MLKRTCSSSGPALLLLSCLSSIVRVYACISLDAFGGPRNASNCVVCQMERDVEALLAGQPLPPESDEFLTAWVDADREAIKSEYAFRMGYNLYKQETASRDWNGIAEGGFR